MRKIIFNKGILIYLSIRFYTVFLSKVMRSHKTSFNIKLSKYYATRWENIYKQLKNYLKNKDDKSLHKARVEIKKLTALFHLVDYCEKKFGPSKKLKPLNTIFKLSGKLRDAKNALTFFEQFKVAPVDFKKQELKQYKARKKLKNKLHDYRDRLNKMEKRGALHIKNIKAKQIDLFLQKKKHEIISERVYNIIAERLHEVRKKIKDVIYVTDFGSGKIFTTAEVLLLNEIQNEIGNWHDIDKFCRKIKERGPSEKQKINLARAEAERRKLLTQSKARLKVYANNTIT